MTVNAMHEVKIFIEFLASVVSRDASRKFEDAEPGFDLGGRSGRIRAVIIIFGES